MAAALLAGSVPSVSHAKKTTSQQIQEKEEQMEVVCNVLEYGAIALMAILTISIILISRRVSSVIAAGISKGTADETDIVCCTAASTGLGNSQSHFVQVVFA